MSGSTWKIGPFSERNPNCNIKTATENSGKTLRDLHTYSIVQRTPDYFVKIDKPLRIFRNKNSKFNILQYRRYLKLSSATPI